MEDIWRYICELATITYHKSYPTTTARLSWIEIECISKVQDEGKYIRVIIRNPGLSQCDYNKFL